MSFLFIYLIKSSLSLAILFLGYELFFRKEAYFRFSRFLLLFTLLVVIILPLLPYNAAHIVSLASIPLSEVVIYSQITQYTLDEVVIRANDQPLNFLNEMSIGLIVLMIYIS